MATVVSYRGTWIETDVVYRNPNNAQSYLIEVRGLKLFFAQLIY